MTLDDLRVFAAVCQAGSLSAVARDLSCTQSAVSQHVKRLERELGVSLIERHPRGVVPTHAGRLLRTAVADGLGGIDQAMRRIGELARGAGGSVRVTTGSTSIRHFMSAAVVDFRRSFPQVSLEFQTETSNRSCFDALAAGRVDLAWITLGSQVRGIEQRAVVELPWVLAVADGDPLAARDAIEPADLQDARLIGLPQNSASRSRLDSWLAEYGIRPVFDTSVADWDTAILLAQLGLGHAVVPALPDWQAPGRRGLRLIPVPALPVLTAGWAVRHWDTLPPPARAFADTVARHCARGSAGA
ncbi:LysR family transcriptional regulator [Kitasatospora sp. A2-31]|uniref:LysR family transcriptional regulator n=1 Tax=Kitasatospora sp. A2-31 TaxID=2916414 RepID=UPI001EEE26EC|nr:LysR family transcriptional regulator [Kitasatospora sp. A2-31]MCG6498878.1 LysR family transcriptional regulator [Kitasatospora sp. A2-31]MCG6500080.1 LysR family transcriptional regulator [Kitasatospora sp. A2-31]